MYRARKRRVLTQSYDNLSPYTIVKRQQSTHHKKLRYIYYVQQYILNICPGKIFFSYISFEFILERYVAKPLGLLGAKEVVFINCRNMQND